MASIFAVFALHTGRVFKKVTTQRTSHYIIELLNHKLVAIQLVNLFFALADSAFAIEPYIERSPIFILFRKTHREMYLSNGFQRKPGFNGRGIGRILTSHMGTQVALR